MDYLIQARENLPDLAGTRVALITRELTAAYAVQHRLVYQGRWLLDAGAQVLVVALGHLGEAHQMLQAAGVPSTALFRRHRTWNLETGRALAQVLKEFSPDVILAQGYDANHHACLARLFGAPGGFGIVHITPIEKFHRWLALVACSNVPDLVVCQSPDMLRRYARTVPYPRKKLRLLPNGVDVDKFSPAVSADRVQWELRTSGHYPVLLCVARLHIPQKAHDVLLQAFAQVRRKFPQARLLLAGDGPDKGEIEALADRLGLCDAVTFLGKRGDVPELLAAADIFVLLSRWESDCNAVREAAAAAKPIVTTRNPGTYFLRDGVDALLVEPNDARAAAEAIIRLSEDRELAERLGQAARASMVQNYSYEVFRRRFFTLIDELRELGRRRASQARRAA